MRCSHCKREGAYIRLHTGEIVCNKCGCIEETKQENSTQSNSEENKKE